MNWAENPNLKRVRRLLKKNMLVFLLGLITSLDFYENAMFVFSANHIMGGIHATPREFAQIQAAYAIGSILMISLQQWATRNFGYRNYLVAAIGIFIAGTIGCGLCSSYSSFLVSRFVQGFGCGAFFVSCRILVNMLFVVKNRLVVAKYFILMTFTATGLGPIVASYFVDSFGWQSIFITILPASFLALILSFLLLPQAKLIKNKEKYPALSFMVLAAAIFCLQLVLAEARYDFFDEPFKLLGFTALGVIVLSGFAWLQFNHHNPIMLLHNFKDQKYIFGLLLYFVYYFISNFSSYMFPMYAENALSFPVLKVGILNGMTGLFGVIVVYVFIKFFAKLGHNKLYMVVSALCMALMSFMFSKLPPDTSLMAFVPGLLLKGVFAVFFVLPAAGETFRHLNDNDFTHAYQGKNILRQMAASLSISIASVLLADRQYVVSSEIASTITPESFPAMQMIKQGGRELLNNINYNILNEMVTKQANIIAVQNLYLLMGIFSIIAAILVGMQKKIR